MGAELLGRVHVLPTEAQSWRDGMWECPPLDFCLWPQPYHAACLLGHVNTAFQRPGFGWVESQRSNVQIFRLNGANPRLFQSSAVKCMISLW